MFSSTANEIIDRLKICSRKGKGALASWGTRKRHLKDSLSLAMVQYLKDSKGGKKTIEIHKRSFKLIDMLRCKLNNIRTHTVQADRVLISVRSRLRSRLRSRRVWFCVRVNCHTIPGTIYLQRVYGFHYSLGSNCLLTTCFKANQLIFFLQINLCKKSYLKSH
jgi:hypothetical protein